MSGRASTASRGLTGMTKPAPTRLASASRAAKRARVTSGPSALARARASGKDSESGADASAWRGATHVETTAHDTHRKHARALLKRNFKAEPPGNEVGREKHARRSVTKQARQHCGTCQERCTADTRGGDSARTQLRV